MDVGIGRAMGVAGICPMQFRRPAKVNKKTHEEEEKENKEFQTKHGITAGGNNEAEIATPMTVAI